MRDQVKKKLSYYRDDRIVIILTPGMIEKPEQSFCLSFQKNSSESDDGMETGQMMGMEITNEVEAELKAEARRATNTGKIQIRCKFLSTIAIRYWS